METIKSLSDLCEFFDASGPDELNRRLYREHGACINICVGQIKQVVNTYTLEFEMGEKHPTVKSIRKNGEFCRFNGLHVDINHLFHLRLDGDTVEADAFKSVEDLLSGCSEFINRQDETTPGTDFVKIKQVEGNTVTVIHGHLHDDSHWLESGNRWKLSKKINLVSFVIHSIIEGSNVTVQSEPFVVPVETTVVEEWLSEMEKQVDFYWKRENYSHWILKSPEGKEFYLDTGWSENIWNDDGGVPENVKKRAVSWTELQAENLIGITHRFGVKGWTIEEYQDESTYEG